MIYKTISKALRVLSILLICFAFVNCQNKQNAASLEGEEGDAGGAGPGLTGGGNGGGLGGGLDDLLGGGGGGGSGGGSGAGGAVTNSDKQALQNVAKVITDPDIAPAEGDFEIPDEIQSLIEQMKRDQAAKRDVSAQRFLIAGKMLQQCTLSSQKYVPIPGQPLLGSWRTQGAAGISKENQQHGNNRQAAAKAAPATGACSVSFNVAGDGKGQVYAVTGGTQGQLGAYPDGHFEIRGNPFSGNGNDTGFRGQNLSGVGSLTNPQFKKTKYGFEPCTTKVELVRSTNPIPQNYQKAMRATGACYRKALALLSMGDIFDKMDPQLSQLLQQRLLGGESD